MPSQNSVLAERPGTPHAGIGDKIRGALAVGKTRWGMLALVRQANASECGCVAVPARAR